MPEASSQGSGLPLIKTIGGYYARLLHEMPNDEGNERDEGCNHEEWQARDTGCMPGLRYEDV